MEPDALAQVLCQLPEFYDPNLLVGFETSDDAAVYQISDSHAMIQTVDIFPPIVDDPFLYGQIAAANSLSDVYAMGGQPKLAMNIVCMPETLDKEIILEILQGGYSKCKEASAVICGGHTIKNPEPIYGLCVTGFIEKSAYSAQQQRKARRCSDSYQGFRYGSFEYGIEGRFNFRFNGKSVV